MNKAEFLQKTLFYRMVLLNVFYLQPKAPSTLFPRNSPSLFLYKKAVLWSLFPFDPNRCWGAVSGRGYLVYLGITSTLWHNYLLWGILSQLSSINMRHKMLWIEVLCYSNPLELTWGGKFLHKQFWAELLAAAQNLKLFTYNFPGLQPGDGASMSTFF